jgi:aryl-alcohol dehydrogenase-like predicted oxidoreductase
VNREHAEDYGWLQRLSDTMAMSRDTETGLPATPQDKMARLQTLVDHYMSGSADWNRASGPRGPQAPRKIAAIQQVADLRGISYAEAEVIVVNKALAELTSGGGLRALEELRSSGAIAGFGMGVNEIAACLEVMNHARLDVILLAGRYTLLEQNALDDLFPRCAEAGTAIVVGGPYNSGILALGTKTGAPLYYNYELAPADIIDKVRKIEAVCDSHGVPLAAAALQFPLAHPLVASVIPGLDSPQRVEQTVALYRHNIPAALWQDLKSQKLLREDAPTP